MEASTIGQYRIVEPLGQGGMGVVYRARHLTSERAVALKTVRLPAPRWLDSIRREIQALTRVRHPGVVRIVDHGVHEGRPWYAMDLLEGETLRQFARRIWSPYQAYESGLSPITQTEELSGVAEFEALEASDGISWTTRHRAALAGGTSAGAGELTMILRVMRRICASLAFMHGEGFINRDLKPENIVLVEGRPVIIDFGLTTQHPSNTGREELEAQLGIAGTVHYMSPEQVRGELVDARSDLYAIGCILYELITGRPPFTGAPRAVMTQHRNEPPVAPSQRVDGVPPALDRLILRLLEKHPRERPGYADEVAAELAELGQDLPRLPDYPPARSYLYRPGFVGREELVAELGALRDGALRGEGAFVLLGGESGSGKTRVAMEVTRKRKPQMRLVTGEPAAVAEAETRIASAPLQAFKPLLRAMSDECLARGRDFSARVLGEHQSILALYEPQLLHVPTAFPLETPASLPLDAARRRLFRALSETLARFAQEQPLLFVIDDFGWVDEVTQGFLATLDADWIAKTPLMLLCTYRSEEPSEAVQRVSALPHVVVRTLPRLGSGPVRSMVSDMLALAEPEEDFADFVMREAEGNPFFVAEYLRAAVQERVLYRNQTYAWQVRGGVEHALKLPRSLRALIDQRLRTLGTAAKQVSVAASVLGRELDFEMLRQVSGLPDSTCITAVDELVRRQILEQTDEGTLRFVHDKLREETYRAAPADSLRQLHAHAALMLEARQPPGDAGAPAWATLGNHFAAAGIHESAVRYLTLAAGFAQRGSAHQDALELYAAAIEQARALHESLSGSAQLMSLHEAHGDLLTLLGHHDRARAEYDSALIHATDPLLSHSRLHRKIGKTWERQEAYSTALDQYLLAARDLPIPDARSSQEALDEWLQVRIDQMWVHYWVAHLDELNDLSQELAPSIDRGSPAQRARYFGCLLRRNLRRERYRISEESLQFARAQVEACRVGQLHEELPNALFEYGFALFLVDEIAEAEAALSATLAMFRKSGDVAQQVRCLSYLTLCARLFERVDETERWATQSESAARATGLSVYVAGALANRAWVSLRRGSSANARTLAEEALAVWRESAVYPFEWLALGPLLAMALADERLEEAVSFARRLLSPQQYPLPDGAPLALRRAVEEFERGERTEAEASLRGALTKLPAGYC